MMHEEFTDSSIFELFLRITYKLDFLETSN